MKYTIPPGIAIAIWLCAAPASAAPAILDSIPLIDQGVNVNAGGQSDLALNSRARKLYISNSETNSVTIFSLDTKRIVNVRVGDEPSGIAVNETTGRVFVANENGHSVSVIDANDQVIAEIPMVVGLGGSLNRRPIELLVDELRNQVAAICMDAHRLVLIDGENLVTTAVFPLDSSPFRGAIDISTNTSYVATAASGAVNKVPLGGGDPVVTLPAEMTQQDLFLHSAGGWLAVGTDEGFAGEDRLYIMDLDGLPLKTFDFGRVFDSAWTMTWVPDQAKLAINTATDPEIYLVDPLGSGGSTPVDITCGPAPSALRSRIVSTTDIVYSSSLGRLVTTQPGFAGISSTGTYIALTNPADGTSTCIAVPRLGFADRSAITRQRRLDLIALDEATSTIYTLGFDHAIKEIQPLPTPTINSYYIGHRVVRLVFDRVRGKLYTVERRLDLSAASKTAPTSVSLIISPATNQVEPLDLGVDLVDAAVDTTNGRVYYGATEPDLLDNRLIEFNPDTRQTTSMPLPGEPLRLLADSGQRRLFVVYKMDTGGFHMGMVNTATFEWIWSFPLQEEFSELGIDEALHQVYVLLTNNDAVWVVSNTTCDTATACTATPPDAELAGVEPGGLPIQVVANPNTSQIYVAERNLDSVAVLDGTDIAAPAKYVTVGDKPIDLAIDPERNFVYVANNNSSFISKIDGNQVMEATTQAELDAAVVNIEVGTYPLELAIDPDERRLFVVLSKGLIGGVSAFAQVDLTVDEASTIPLGGDLTALAYDNVSKIAFVVDTETATLYELTDVAVPVASAPILLVLLGGCLGWGVRRAGTRQSRARSSRRPRRPLLSR